MRITKTVGVAALVALSSGVAQAQHRGGKGGEAPTVLTPTPPPAPAPPPAPPAPPAPAAPSAGGTSDAASGGQQERGFVLEGRLGSNLAGIAGGTQVGVLSGGFFLGYKLDRLIVGFGLELGSVTGSTESSTMIGAMNTTAGSSSTSTLFLFEPGVRFAILRSADRRVELIGDIDVGIGRIFTSRSTTPPPMPQMGVTETSGGYHLAYVLAPGARYWLHPQMAVGFIAGVRGEYDSQSNGAMSANGGVTSSMNKTDTALAHSFMAQLQLTGVF